jgi:hypothetical protein
MMLVRMIAIAGLLLAWVGVAAAAPPAPTIAGPRVTYDASPQFRFSARGARSYACAFDTTRLHPCAARYSQALTVGLHVLRVRAVDAAGNRGAISTVTVQRRARMVGLTVSTTGSGTVVIDPGGRRCSGTCTVRLPAGTVAAVRAAPDAGFYLGGWSGACGGSGFVCRVAMTAARSATASFSPLAYEFAITVTGSGTVLGTSPFECPGTCTAWIPFGTTVTLTPSPAPGWAFAGWTGDAPAPHRAWSR